MAYGIKVAKPNEDVKIATNEELILNSEQECLKIEDGSPISDSLTLSDWVFSGPGWESDSVYNDHSHSLDCYPAVRLFYKDGNTIFEAPYYYQERYSVSGPFVGYDFALFPQIYNDKIRVILVGGCIDTDYPGMTVDYILYTFANKLA